MASLAPTLPYTRQPFGCIDGNRLRNLTSAKNRQNAIPASTSAKRLRPLDEDTWADSENVDPILNSPSKKMKSVIQDATKSSQLSKFVLKQTTPGFVTKSTPATAPSRLSIPSARSTPLSTGGRSPKSKRIGILSRRRVSNSPFTRVDPPAFALEQKGSNGLPFSIDAALSVAMPSLCPSSASPSTLEETAPSGWLFDIHEDSPEEELRNLVEFSTQTLDISDDESKSPDHDHRGKENIPPSELPGGISAAIDNNVASTVSISRKDMMTDESRKPLADLDARDLHGEEEGAGSCSMSEQKPSLDDGKSPFAFNEMAAQSTRTTSPVETRTGNQDAWKDILAQVVQKSQDAISVCETTPWEVAPDLTQNESVFEIWESESAKGDNGGQNLDPITCPS